ncbi:MAG: hypothetical protein H7Y38_12935 [Armatimonadetes bacterium]|nr:hypothetical protein [Armatimonadota bacterium]
MQATLTFPGADPLIIDLPRSAYNRMLSLSPDDRAHFAAIGLTAAYNAADDDEDDDTEPTEEDYAAIGRGLADMDAGRVSPANEVFNAIRAKHGFAKGNSPI